jgi:phosphoribosyl-dephospho-CoA transferase
MNPSSRTSRRSSKPEPLELLTLRDENAALREEVKYHRNRAARLDHYIKTQMKPLVTMGIVQGGRIKTLERKIRRLTINPEKVVERMEGNPIWLDYCFEDDGFQAGREIVLAVLKAAGVK